jgi:uncharacterized membrane protein
MATADISPQGPSVADAVNWIAFGTGAALVAAAVSRRSALGPALAVSSLPFFYRGITGHWPGLRDEARTGDTREALRGPRGVNVHEAVRLDCPVAQVYRYWRNLENLPRFMSHLERVTETSERHSSWTARGPAGLRVEWDAEIINEIDNELLAWRSLPGSDVVSAGSVTFRSLRNGQSTQVNVNLQYSSPAGKPGAYLASLFGLEASQVIREDLRRFKQLLEAGEVSRATATP